MAHNNYKEDMLWANEQFIKIVWQSMKKVIQNGEGEMLSVEKNSDILYKKLDQNSGIDYIHINDYRMNGFAVRVQVMDKWNDRYSPYNTFTIRDSRSSGAETEYKKRLDQILNEDIYPRYTLQAYITNNKADPVFLSGAVMRTKDLYLNAEYLDMNVDHKKGGDWWFDDNKGRYADKSVFRVIPWGTMIKMANPEYGDRKPIKIVTNNNVSADKTA